MCRNRCGGLNRKIDSVKRPEFTTNFYSRVDMSVYVVTGGAGFIGSHIVDALVERGDHVRVVDSLVAGRMENLDRSLPHIDFVQADICEAETLARVFEGADYVFHHAALASVPLSVEKPLMVNQACVTGTLTVLDQARKANVKRVVYASTSAAYGDRPFSANRETDTPMTLSPYAVAKLAGENYCHAFYHSYGFEAVALRYFNVFGPRQDPNSHYSAVIPLFITWLLSGKNPTVFGDGKQSRDFAYVGNVVDANLRAMAAPNVAGRTFNIANGRSTTLLDLLNTLGDLLGVQVTPDFQPPRAGDIRDSMADISMAVRDLGYLPQVELEEGLRRSIEYYKTTIQTVQ